MLLVFLCGLGGRFIITLVCLVCDFPIFSWIADVLGLTVLVLVHRFVGLVFVFLGLAWRFGLFCLFGFVCWWFVYLGIDAAFVCFESGCLLAVVWVFYYIALICVGI